MNYLTATLALLGVLWFSGCTTTPNALKSPPLVSPIKATAAGSTIANSHWVERDHLLRGMAPIKDEDFETLRRLGIEEVLIFKLQRTDEVDEETKKLVQRGFAAEKIHHVPFAWKEIESFEK